MGNEESRGLPGQFSQKKYKIEKKKGEKKVKGQRSVFSKLEAWAGGKGDRDRKENHKCWRKPESHGGLGGKVLGATL